MEKFLYLPGHKLVNFKKNSVLMFSRLLHMINNTIFSELNRVIFVFSSKSTLRAL